jgi:hypothetical protein
MLLERGGGGRHHKAFMGQFLPPRLATVMEELASTPDAKAHNRRATF